MYAHVCDARRHDISKITSTTRQMSEDQTREAEKAKWTKIQQGIMIEHKKKPQEAAVKAAKAPGTGARAPPSRKRSREESDDEDDTREDPPSSTAISC